MSYFVFAPFALIAFLVLRAIINPSRLDHRGGAAGQPLGDSSGGDGGFALPADGGGGGGCDSGGGDGGAGCD